MVTVAETPSNTNILTSLVPYVAVEKKPRPARIPFEQFPLLLAEDLSDQSYLERGLYKLESTKVARLFQSWLFFELLEQFFDTSINQSEYLVSHDSGNGHNVYLTEDQLWSLFSHRKRQMRKMSAQERRQNTEPWTLDLLDSATSILEQFDDPRLYVPGYCLGEIALSIRLLVGILHKVADALFESLSFNTWNPLSWSAVYLPLSSYGRDKLAFQSLMKKKRLPFAAVLPPGCRKPSNSARLLLERLCAGAWCWPEAVRLCQIYDTSIVHYLSELKQDTQRSADHSACPTSGLTATCKAHDNFQEVLHADRNCSCSHKAIDLSQLISIIEEGSIPLVEMNIETLDVRLIRWSPLTSYVALSYTASDGLLNRRHNSLPTCQMAYIRQCLLQTTGRFFHFNQIKTQWPFKQLTAIFWMDTFCIPTKLPLPSRLADLKLKAISKMAPIYGGASYVLVLNRQLEDVFRFKYADGSFNDDELAGHILTSAWNTRAWTLQEGVLAKSCYFKTATGLYCFRSNEFTKRWLALRRAVRRNLPSAADKARSILEKISQHTKIPPRPKVLSDVLTQASIALPQALSHTLQEDVAYIKTLSQGSKRDNLLSDWRISQFTRAWNNLLRRSLAEESDRLSIFANLLDFNPHNLGRIPDPAQKLATLIRSCGRLPLSLLFNRAAKKVDPVNSVEGWLPAEIAGGDLSDNASMRYTAKGLKIELREPLKDSSIVLYRLGKLQTIPQICLLSDKITTKRYVIEIQGSCPFIDQDKDYCLLLDLSAGSRSYVGFAAAGALMSIEISEEKSSLIRYHAQLLAWHPDSTFAAEHLARSQDEPASFECTNEFTGHEYFVQCLASEWQPDKRLPRRDPTPDQAVVTFGIILLVAAYAFYQILGGSRWMYTNFTAKLSVQCVCLFVIFANVHWFFGVLHNLAWHETFADDWDGRQGVLALPRAFVTFVRIAVRTNRPIPRDVDYEDALE